MKLREMMERESNRNCITVYVDQLGRLEYVRQHEIKDFLDCDVNYAEYDYDYNEVIITIKGR